MSAKATGAGAKTIWAASFRAISRIDPAASELVPGRSSAWAPLAFGFGSLWTHDFLPGRSGLVRLVPSTLEHRASVICPCARDIAVGEGSVWVADERGRVWQVDPARNAVENVVEVGPQIFALAAGVGSVWVATNDGAVIRIDPATRETKRIDIGRTPLGIAIGGGLVWVSVVDWEL